MDCQRCGHPATLHVVQTAAAGKREVRLCDACAKAADLLPPHAGPGGAELNYPALVALLMGLPAAAGLACPGCGQTFGAFRADGRLGCPAEYDAFRSALLPLLDRIHRRTEHSGKRPRAAGRHQLRADLRAAVAAERYEDAARIRDALRADPVAEGGDGADEPG